MNKKLSIFCFLFLQIVTPLAAQDKTADTPTQKYTFIFRGTLLENAIEKLVTKTKIDLIYDPSILNDQHVFSISQKKKPKQVLSHILQNTNLDYIQLSSGTYVIIESANTDSKFGNLTGIVLDRQTGQPLEGANVLLADASTGASTNNVGRFTLAPVLSGTYEVNITYVGYKSIRDTVSVPLKESGARRFYLQSRPVFVEPIIVSSIQRRLPYQNSSGGEVTDLRSVAPYLGSPDAIKSINSVMGVNFSIPLADFNVQGGAEGEHRVLLDGTPIYNPVSFGRLIGAFSPYALKKITVHKAGFRASAGSQLSGVVSIEQDLPADSEDSAILETDPLNLNARVNLTSSLSKDISVKTMLAARSNIWRWYQKPSLANTLEDWDRLDPLITGHLLNSDSQTIAFKPKNHQSDINFYDFHLANKITFNDFHSSYLSFYRGKNNLQTRLLSHNAVLNNSLPQSMYTTDTYDWVNTAARFEHNWLINSRLQNNFAISYSRHTSDHKFGMASTNELSFAPINDFAIIKSLDKNIKNLPHTGDQNLLTETAFNATFEYSLNPHHKLNIGFKPKIVDYSFQLSDLFYHFSSSKNRMYLIPAFLEDEYTINYSTKLIAGSRFTYVPKHQKFFAEPRLSIQKDFPHTPVGFLSLKLSTGLYRQFINQFDVTNVGPSTIVPSIRFWVPVDYTTDVPKAYHISTEALIEPTESFSLRWEGFYKWDPSIPALDYHALLDNSSSLMNTYSSQSKFIVHGKSYSLGTGIRAKKLIEELMMELSLSYQYNIAKQKIPKRFDNQFVYTPWNEPHKFTAGLNWKINSSFTSLLRWKSIWGRTWAFNRSYYDYLTINENESKYGSIDINSPSDDKLSPFYQLDLGISYKKSTGFSQLRFQLNLNNFLNRHNTLEKQIISSLTPNDEIHYSIRDKKLPGLTPSFSLELSF